MPKKVYQAGYKKAFEDNKLVGAIASTPDPDRDGEIVDPMGMEMTQFKKNPVLLWGHDHFSLPIGKVTDIRATVEGIEFDAEFAEGNEFAQDVKNLFRQGILNAFSIGFIPLERRNEKITRAELLEISAVNIPANPMALNNRAYKAFTKSLDEMTKGKGDMMHMMEEHIDMMDEEMRAVMDDHISEMRKIMNGMPDEMPEKNSEAPHEKDVAGVKIVKKVEVEEVKKIEKKDDKKLEKTILQEVKKINKQMDTLLKKKQASKKQPSKYKAQLNILRKVSK